jgi:putative salt-induced outer membrane protein YdiY
MFRDVQYMKPASLGKIIPINLMIASATLYSPGAMADEPPRDGLWHANGGLAITLSAGNTRSQSLNLNANANRRTARDKWSLYAQALGSRAESNGLTSTTANQWSGGARYDHNISKNLFGYTGLDFGRDMIKLLRLRSLASVGLGTHLVNTDDTQWDIFGGASYRSEEYIDPGVMVRNQLRTKLNSAETMVGEESTNTLTPSTTFMQRFTASYGLNRDGGYRATFDTSLSVAINQTLSLKVSLQDRYDSLAEEPIKPNDLLFFTGVNVKFGS